MVEHLPDKIMLPKKELNTEVNIFRKSYSSKFFKASTYLYKVVARLYLTANPSSRRFRKRSIYAAGREECDVGRGGCFNISVRGRGREGTGE